MGDNADPQQVLVLTKEECRKKGEQLSMPTEWGKIGDALAKAGLFHWHKVKNAQKKQIETAITLAVGADAMEGFCDELMDMIGIGVFAKPEVGPGLRVSDKTARPKAKTDRKYKTSSVEAEPPSHETIEIPRQYFVDAGVEGLPLGNGSMTPNQLTQVTDIVINRIFLGMCHTPYASDVPKLTQRVASQILLNVGNMPDRKAGKTVVLGRDRDLVKYLITKSGNVRQAVGAPPRADGKTRFDNIANFDGMDLDDDEQMSAFYAAGAAGTAFAFLSASPSARVKRASSYVCEFQNMCEKQKGLFVHSQKQKVIVCRA